MAGNKNDSIILDFFSGSAATGQAVMQCNSEDDGSRKFIMVQLPDKCDKRSEAYKAGYANICEIGKERIRRAAKKIHEEHPDAKFDDGFRVFKVDESNMTDVYYSADSYDQNMLNQLESNIKPDRTDLDLLFGCLIEWGLPLSMDDSRKAILKDIFWQMNEISSRTETNTETVIEESDDGNGNIVETTTTVTRTTLYITVSHKTAEEMADHFNFNADQQAQLAELLADENNSLWAAVLYGIGVSDDAIVAVALSQVGNIGGQPYWSWYGFEGRVEWCACFVSWCANECGYIENGIIPKFAGCVNGVQWFKDRGQWADNSIEPTPGMIIFFDWDSPNGSSGSQDGLSDHVGIVEKCENGIVYTIEGNSGNACRQRQYPVGYYEILGYGIPAY